MIRRPPRSTLFPYTRSSDLAQRLFAAVRPVRIDKEPRFANGVARNLDPLEVVLRLADRKSTRLNSSHPSISYAVFCLKKKNFHLSLPNGARCSPSSPE